MNARLEPFICEASDVAARPVREFLLRVGIEEKHWPVDEVDVLLAWPGATFVGVRHERARVIAAGQVLHEGRPFPVEKAFPGCIVDSVVPVEVSIIGIDSIHRRGGGTYWSSTP